MGLSEKLYFVFIHILLPLFFGGLIYILFRSTNLRMFEWFNFIGLEDIIFKSRAFFSIFKKYLPNWFYFSLPDALWIYSFNSAIITYWNNKKDKLKIWIVIPFTFGIIIEIFQCFKLFPGTFDYLDLIFSITFFSLSIIITNSKFKQNEEKLS